MAERNIIMLKPIGVIHSQYKTMEETPIQPWKSDKIGEVEVFPEFEEGLKDIEGFSHIMLLYFFHKVSDERLSVIPYLDPKPKGVFATRHPHRPNHIGLSIVKLRERKNNILRVKHIDIIDGTPLLDIKPYVSKFDKREDVKDGWLEGKLS